MSSEDIEQLLVSQLQILKVFVARMKDEHDKTLKQIEELKNDIKDRKKYDYKYLHQRFCSLEQKLCNIQDLMNRIPDDLFLLDAADNGPVQAAVEENVQEELQNISIPLIEKDDDAPEDPVTKRQRTLALLQHMHTTPIVEISYNDNRNK